MKKLTPWLFSLVLLLSVSCDNEPIDSELDNGDDPTGQLCVDAIQAVVDATILFINTPVTSENYPTVCMAYRQALENQITACGDEDGTLQMTIDTLGDCEGDSMGACELAEQATDAAELAFDNATEANYTELCTAYRTALENEITICGDPDGFLQEDIDALGDCTPTPLDVEISVTAGTLPIEFDMVDVVVEGNLLKVSGEASGSGYTIYFEVEQGLTGVDIINDTFSLTLTSEFFPSTAGFDDFTSEITQNTTGTLKGDFGGIVTNANNGDLNLSAGDINISY